MKFLLFNLVVAGALVYLFTADRADVHMAADKVYEAAGDIKSVARNAVGKGRKLLRGDDAAPAPLPVAPKPLPKTEQKPVPKVSPAPPPVKRLVRSAPAPVVSPKVVPTLPPEVAHRRAEVLGTAPPKPAPRPIAEIKQGEGFMSPAERRKELFSLAEEMELLYARKISQ